MRIPTLGQMRKRLFGISPEAAKFARRGFCATEPEAQRRLESIGGIFLQGYHAALEETDLETLALCLGAVEKEFRGFAFEGAAMGLALLDRLMPWKDRWSKFVSGFGAQHIYMMHVGIGWAFARLRRRITPYLIHLDPLLGWLAVGGFGFHEGYFHWKYYIQQQQHPPRQLKGYARRVFDQGLGRSIWFVLGANVNQIPNVIAAFPPARCGDLWSGIGLACAYAGGVDDRNSVEVLQDAARLYRAQLAQGAAFAAQTRMRAGNPTLHTETVCQVLCGMSMEEAADMTNICLKDLRGQAGVPAYELWRRRIQVNLVQEGPRACQYM